MLTNFGVKSAPRGAAKAPRSVERKSDDETYTDDIGRATLQEALDEIIALQREDRPDLEMLADMRTRVLDVTLRTQDSNLLQAAEGILREILMLEERYAESQSED